VHFYAEIIDVTDRRAFSSSGSQDHLPVSLNQQIADLRPGIYFRSIGTEAANVNKTVKVLKP